MSIWIWALHFDIFSWWLTKRERQRPTRKKEKQRKLCKWWRDVEMSRLHATHLAKAMTQNHLRFDSRFDLKKRRVFFSNEFRRQKIEGQQKGNNTRKLLLRCWPKMLSYSIEAFLPNACSKKSGSAQQATRKCLGSDFKSNSGFNMIQPMLQQNPSEPLRICPSLSRRRSSNQATQSSSHGHAPNRTWSYLANLHWKTIFGIMKHSETSPFIASLSHVSWFYHLYHVTYLVSSFPLAALARLRQTSSDP